jgi:hypothetical protein
MATADPARHLRISSMYRFLTLETPGVEGCKMKGVGVKAEYSLRSE